jgi:hypothetical protein
MPRRHVVFDDQFFESLSRRVSDERDGRGRPSRSDVLAYIVMPLMDLLAADYEGSTIVIEDHANLRVMVQTSAFVEWVRLWCYTDGDEVHVYEIDLEFFEPDTDGHDGDIE